MPFSDLSTGVPRLENRGMRPPQSTIRRLSIRLFFLASTVFFVAMLPLRVRAATQQLTSTPQSMRFGVVLLGQSESQTAAFKNVGTTSVTISAVHLTGTEFKMSPLTLPLTLTPGERATVKLTFTPTVVGWTGWPGGTLTITSNASNPTLQLAMGGTGATSAPLAATPSSMSFGELTLGLSSKRSVVLTNPRTTSITLNSMQLTGNEFSVKGPVFPVTLAGGQSTTLNITFAPRWAGNTWGSVFIYGPKLNIPLAGTGTTSGLMSIAPAPLSFGNVTVGTTETQAITMTAKGASVTVSSEASSNSQFVLDGATLPFTIAAGQSKSFNVSFTPKASGTISGSLSFTSNAAISKMAESLVGVGTVDQHSVSLWWNPSTSEAVGYNVYRSTSSSGPYSKINPSLDLNTAYIDGTVASGHTYYYGATAVDSSGKESGLSTPPVKAAIP